MEFNHAKLLGRLKEFGMTQENLAEKIGMAKATLNLKLNGKAYFTSKEMAKILEELKIPFEEVSAYFFFK